MCDLQSSLTSLLTHFPAIRSYDGPLMAEEALLGAAQGGLSSPEYVDLYRWLVCRLKPLCDLEEDVTSGPGELPPSHMVQ